MIIVRCNFRNKVDGAWTVAYNWTVWSSGSSRSQQTARRLMTWSTNELKEMTWLTACWCYSVTWEHPQLRVRSCPGTARVVSQTAVCGWVRWLDAADLQRAGWQCCQAGVRVKGQREVLPVLLPPDDGSWVAWDLTAQQGSVTKISWHWLSRNNHLQWAWGETRGEKCFLIKSNITIYINQKVV